ncbi:hypothetical protein GGX14DRAFT_615461 [Mycena pura]|uniref:Uncharacterized protein n=1 Tax=Mycena pura TaxID=153505 RepID=A0AAD6YT98_9AGAR|nr:hypothetical protein GGX14DRAFT_615461 [Mycena pura]
MSSERFNVASHHSRNNRNCSSSTWPSAADQTEVGDSYQLLGKRFRDDCGDLDDASSPGPTKAKRIRNRPRSSGHRMSEEARQKKIDKWRKRAAEKRKKHEEIVELDKRPCEFIRFRSDNVEVRKALRRSHGYTKKCELPVFEKARDDTKDVVLTCPPPSEEEQKVLGSLCRLTDEKMKTLKPQTVADVEKLSLSSNVLIRISKVVPLSCLDIIMQQYKRLVHMGFVSYEKNQSRSATPALHAGVWRRYSSTACIVSEVWQERAPPEKIKALSGLIQDICQYFKQHILPLMLRKIQQYYPEFFKLQGVIADEIGKIKGIAEYPEFNLGGPFSTFAMKIGSSEYIHLDHFDPRFLLAPTGILTGGNFSGADLNIPQLGGRMPIKAGMLVAANMRTLAHSSSQHTGDRLAITLFLDNPLLISALQNATRIL